MHGRPGSEIALVAAGTGQIALDPPAIDKPMLVALANRKLVPVGSADLL